MRASSAHIAYRQPRHADELTRHLRDTQPATIVREEIATAVATSIVEAMSADDQLWRMSRDDTAFLRGIPLQRAGPGYIAFSQPERQTIALLSRDVAWLALQCANGASARAATAPDPPPPLP